MPGSRNTGRYRPLAEHLERLDEPIWEASFQDIEGIIGSQLPDSAYKYPAWWANQSGAGHSQTAGWLSVGWRTANLDLAARRVRFERNTGMRAIKVRAANDDQLIAEARKWTGIRDDATLVREGLRALIAREAAARLARLGGTMPDFQEPPRDRPA